MENSLLSISIRQFIEDLESGKYDSPDVITQINAGWYDWFCKDSSLVSKTKNLGKKMMKIADSSRISKDIMSLSFKNCCPLYGSLYDCVRICDIHTGDVIYTIAINRKGENGVSISEVYGRNNNWSEPLVKGSWKDVVKWFND